jgi:hypothetical protein
MITVLFHLSSPVRGTRHRAIELSSPAVIRTYMQPLRMRNASDPVIAAAARSAGVHIQVAEVHRAGIRFWLRLRAGRPYAQVCPLCAKERKAAKLNDSLFESLRRSIQRAGGGVRG